MNGETPAALWLDHASIAVPELRAAVDHLEHRLGLRTTVSPGAPERHGRIYLDRSYLEVSLGPGDDRWSASSFFLRFDDPVALRRHLDGVGLGYRFGEYEGVDGTWDDVEIDAPMTMPILVRRTRPPEIARTWPRPLIEPHPCGARRLAEVHVGVPSLRTALDAYGRLLGVSEPSMAVEPRSGRTRATIPTKAGVVVLLEGGTGLERIVLGVGALDAARAVMGAHLSAAGDDAIAWLDPAEAFGLELGFVEGSAGLV